MARKPSLRTGSYIMRVAKIVIPAGRRPYVRFLSGSPQQVARNRVTLFAFYDTRLVWPGWIFHTEKEPVVVASPRARLTLFVDGEHWRDKEMDTLAAIRVVQRDAQAIWGFPIYAGKKALRRFYREAFDNPKGTPRARRRLENALRAADGR